MPVLTGTIKNNSMEKPTVNNAAESEVKKPETIEEALAVIAEKDAEIETLKAALQDSNEAIAAAEKKAESLQQSVAEKQSALSGVDNFEVNGKIITPKFAGVKSAGKHTYFTKTVESKLKDIKPELKQYFGDLSDEDKLAFVESNPQLFI